MRTPAFCMAKVGLKRFPWQAHKVDQRIFPLAGEVYPLAIRVTAETGRALHCFVRCTRSTFCEAPLRPSENIGLQLGPQFDIVPKRAAPHRCFGQYGAWDLAGVRIVRHFTTMSRRAATTAPKRLSIAKAIPPLIRAKGW
jgi:hypothetical protein